MLKGHRCKIAIASLLAVTCFGRTAAEERPLPRIAVTGEAAGGTTDVYYVLDGSPVINPAGEVAFRAGIARADAGPTPTLRRGIWKGNATTSFIEALALSGDPAPDGDGAVYAGFSQPAILTNGDVFFLASTDADLLFDGLYRAASPDDTERLFTAAELAALRLDNLAVNGAGVAVVQTDGGLSRAFSPGSFGVVAFVGDEAPDTGGATFSILNLPTVDAREKLAFLATLGGAGVTLDNDGGAWIETETGLHLLFREGAAAPARAANGNQLIFSSPSAEPTVDGRGGAAFLSPLLGGQLETFGIFRGTSAADLSTVALRGPLVASDAGDVSFTTLSAPAMGADGAVYFAASASVRPPDPRPTALRGVSSLWRSGGAALHLVAGMGGAAPGTTELFGRITSFAVNAQARVAFGAELYDPALQRFTGFGLWAQDASGAVTLLVRTGDTVRISPTDVRTVANAADAIQLLNPWRSITDSLRRGPAEGIPTPRGGSDQTVYRLRFEGGGAIGSHGFFGVAFAPAPPQVRQPVVNSLDDAPDLEPGDGACDTGGDVAGEPECTLRAALQEANASHGMYRITFAIDTPGVAIIFPRSALPAVAQALLIDATTQPDGRVTVSGSSAGAGGVNGITIQAEGCALRGMTITGFSGHGLDSRAGEVTLLAPDISANQGDGIHASSGSVVVEGNLRLVGNAGNGLSAFNDLTVAGEEHEVSTNGQSGIHVEGGVQVSGSLKMVGNGTRRSAVDCAAKAFGAVEALGDVTIEHLEARTNCGSGVVTDGSIDLDFGFLTGNTRYGAISAMGDIRLGIQHEISQNKLDGIRCSEGTLQSFSVELKMIGNEGNGILAKEIRLLSGEVLIEESGLNGIEVSGLLDGRVPLRVNRNGRKREPLACQEHRVGGIVATSGNVNVSQLEADGNCGSGIYCDSGYVLIGAGATLTNNSQFGIWCPTDDVDLEGGPHTISMNGKDGIYAFTGPVRIAGNAVLHGNGRLQPTECATGNVGAIYTQGDFEGGELDIQDNCGSGIRADTVRAGSVRLLMNSQFGIIALGTSTVELVGGEHEIARNGRDGIYAPNAPVNILGKAYVVGNNRSSMPGSCNQDPPAGGGVCTNQRITGDDIEARLNCGTGLIADLGVEVTRLNCSSNTQHGVYSRDGGLLAAGTGHFFSQNGGDGIVTPSGRVEIHGVLEANANGRNGISATDVRLEAGEICNNAQLGIDIFGRPGGVRTGAVRLDCGNGLGPVRTLSGAIITPPPGVAVSGVSSPSPGDAPPGQEFPADFYSVSAGAEGGGGLAGQQGGGAGAEPLAIALVIDLPAGMEVETYFNHGPTADQPVPHWYEFRFDGTTGAEVRPGQIVLHLADGLRGDDDLAQDGALRSLGGPARATAAGELQLPGDCNQDGLFNISDPVCVLGFLFLGAPARLPCGDGAGAHAGNLSLLDWQPDRSINLADAVAGLSFLFLGGPPHALGRGAEPCARIAGCPANRACP